MVSRLLEVLCQEIFRFYLSLANVSLFFLSDPQCLIFFLLVVLMVRVVFAVTVQIPTFFISRIACLVFFSCRGEAVEAEKLKYSLRLMDAVKCDFLASKLMVFCPRRCWADLSILATSSFTGWAAMLR